MKKTLILLSMFSVLLLSGLLAGCAELIDNTPNFVSQTNDMVANTNEILGLVGTSVSSSNTPVATAVISDETVKITSGSEGSATISVFDSSSNAATITVTVSKTGVIMIGTITKYTPGDSTFTPTVNDSIANDEASLGLVGVSAESSDTGIAIAAIEEGKIQITSVAPGSATITVQAAAGHTATIEVTVSAGGAIAIGTITKYTPSGATFTPAVDDSVANDEATLGLVGVSAASSDTGKANVAIVNRKIQIISAAQGNVTITVQDAADHTATIGVTVSETGAITIGAIIKYAQTGGEEAEEEQDHVWIWNKQINYTVTDGVAGSVNYEMEPTWISYSDETHFEEEYAYTIPSNTVQAYDTYTITMSGNFNQTIHFTRNDQTYINESSTVADTTTTVDYVSESTTDTTTHTVIEYEGTTYFDLSSGLTSQQTMVGTSTTTRNEGEPTVTPINTDTYYTIELLNEADGVKTLKHYDISTSGTGSYTVYKIKDGITLETKNYTAGDVLSSTTTYTFPENNIIRAKLLTFTLYNYEYETNPASNTYQTCEVLSDSETALVVRVKTYNSTTGVLTTVYENHYEKFAL
jgi:hypothetical protein